MKVLKVLRNTQHQHKLAIWVLLTLFSILFKNNVVAQEYILPNNEKYWEEEFCIEGKIFFNTLKKTREELFKKKDFFANLRPPEVITDLFGIEVFYNSEKFSFLEKQAYLSRDDPDCGYLELTFGGSVMNPLQFETQQIIVEWGEDYQLTYLAPSFCMTEIMTFLTDSIGFVTIKDDKVSRIIKYDEILLEAFKDEDSYAGNSTYIKIKETDQEIFYSPKSNRDFVFNFFKNSWTKFIISKN